MKRNIVVLALTVCLSIPAFGASITWKSNEDFYAHNGSPISTGSAFLFLVDTNAGYTINNENGKWNISGAELIASANIETNGYIRVTSQVDYDTQYKPNPDMSTGTEVPNSYYYVVVVTSETGATLDSINSGWFYVSETEGLYNNGHMPGTPIEMSEGELVFVKDGSDSDGWQKIVPEPTALALLALGVAGVALRRRKCA